MPAHSMQDAVIAARCGRSRWAYWGVCGHLHPRKPGVTLQHRVRSQHRTHPLAAPHTVLRGSFLIGPKRQFKQMFQAKRAQATLAYIVMMVRRGFPHLRAI